MLPLVVWVSLETYPNVNLMGLDDDSLGVVPCDLLSMGQNVFFSINFIYSIRNTDCRLYLGAAKCIYTFLVLATTYL